MQGRTSTPPGGSTRTKSARPAEIRRLPLTAVGTALGVGVLGAGAAAPVIGLLHLSDPVPIAALVVLLVPHTVIGVYSGIAAADRLAVATVWTATVVERAAVVVVVGVVRALPKRGE